LPEKNEIFQKFALKNRNLLDPFPRLLQISSQITTSEAKAIEARKRRKPVRMKQAYQHSGHQKMQQNLDSAGTVGA